MKMNPEVKARWVKALRSGEYGQTKEVLKDTGGFCCLGVLCDVFAKEDGRREWRVSELSSMADGEFGLHTRDKGMPSALIGIWSGLDFSTRVEIDGDWKTLWQHNDDGSTFAEIADAIEKQL